MALLKPAGMALDTNILAECILQELKVGFTFGHLLWLQIMAFFFHPPSKTTVF